MTTVWRALNFYIIHQLLFVTDPAEHICHAVQWLPASRTVLKCTELISWFLALQCIALTLSQWWRVLQPDCDSISRSSSIIGSGEDINYSIICDPYAQDVFWHVSCPQQTSNHSSHAFTQRTTLLFTCLLFHPVNLMPLKSSSADKSRGGFLHLLGVYSAAHTQFHKPRAWEMSGKMGITPFK